MDDIAIGLKQMFLQAGMWQLGVVAVPTSLPAPVQSPEMLNQHLLHLFFGPSLDGMPAIPKDVCLFVQDEAMLGKLWTRVTGAPPNQTDSFFFDLCPLQTWYLQGRGHWAYVMSFGCE
jgi:hypothetical protein